MLKNKHILLLFWCLGAMYCSNASIAQAAELRLSRIFSDNMVLQREATIPVWGWAKAGVAVTVTFNGATTTGTAGADGKWKALLPPQKAGGPFTLKIATTNDAVIYNNVLVGDVWLCSGQSNMAYKVKDATNGSQEVKAANYPNIRLFEVKRELAMTQQDELANETWVECSPATIADFTAVGYFFARDLQQSINVPIGLIHSSWGGTLIENWMSSEALQAFPEYNAALSAMPAVPLAKLITAGKIAQRQWLTEVEKQDLGMKGKWYENSQNTRNWQSVQLPTIVAAIKGLKSTDGIFWFKTNLKLSKNDLADSLSVSLGLVDDEDITYINGKAIGAMDKKDYKRLYRVAPAVFKEGENTITIRLKNRGAIGGFRSNPELMYVQSIAGRVSLATTWKMAVGTPDLDKYPDNIVHPNQYPSSNFNAMINPLIPFALKGVLWYQGESNAKDAYNYRFLLHAMVKDWRKKWQQEEDFWFLNVQLPLIRNTTPTPVPSGLAEMRESQQKVLELPRTGLAVTMDLGEADNVHPENKQGVGYRLALVAKKKVYNLDVHDQAPVYAKHVVERNKIRVFLDQTNGSARTKDGTKEVTGFIIAGKNQKWKNAQAIIENGSLVVFSKDVSDPVAVRYAWADNPGPLNLVSTSGLPVAPFRTDDWELYTELRAASVKY